MKIFALYLPQFHVIKENNKWWGEGFTEWDNVKKAKKYTKTQIQPRVPLNDNYYDLSKSECIGRQCCMAKKYGIDGFCFYHYYSNGKLLLETPAEILLNHTEFDINFFFSWANHDWRRTWASFNMEILMKQKYGEAEEIKKHFLYLLPFFKDSRYIKIDNKPIFFIYQNVKKEVLQNYYRIFNELAIKEGFDGIYWVGTLKSNQDYYSIELDDYYRFESDFTQHSNYIVSRWLQISRKWQRFMKRLRLNPNPVVINYKYLIKAISITSKLTPNYILGVASGWDNTPRHGENGSFFKNQGPELFERHLENQIKLTKKSRKPFLVINAWNEWGEGAYLEPDKENTYKYLEAVKRIVSKYR